MRKTLLSLLAFFAMVLTATAESITWTSGSDWTGIAEEAATISYTQGTYTLTADQGAGQTKPTVNATANDLRVYAKGTLTVANSAADMTTLVFNISTNGQKRLADITASTGDVKIDNKNWTVTWTGTASSVTFTVGDKAVNGTEPSKAGQFCIASISFDEEGGGETGGETGDEKTTIFSEDFAEGQGTFSIDNKSMDENLSFVWAKSSQNGKNFMKGSGFYKQAYAAESWLVSPVIDLSKATESELTFEQAANFFDSVENFLQACTVKVKVEGEDNWNDLTVEGMPAGNNWNFAKSSADLKAYDGKKIQIAFAYTSTAELAGTWEIATFAVKAKGEAVEPTVPEYNSIAEMKQAATGAKTDMVFKFNELLVTGVAEAYGQKNIYVTDGTDGMLFFGGTTDVKKGDKISGSISGALSLRYGATQVSEPDFSQVTIVSSDNEVTPKVVTFADINNNEGYKTYENMYVRFENISFAAEKVEKQNVTMVDDSDNELTLRDNFSILTDYTFDMTSQYNVSGFVTSYNQAAQVYPMTLNDIELITDLKNPETAWANEEVMIPAGQEWTVNNAFSTLSDAKATFTSSNETVATVDAEGNITVNGFGYAEITAETAETATFLGSKATFRLYVIEGEGSLEKPYTPADVLYFKGRTEGKVWVSGELVGYYDNNAGLVEGTSDKVNTNIVLRVNGVFVPVQLPAGEVREALNQVDHPENLGHKIWVEGDLEAYFNIPGVKNVVHYRIDTIDGIENVESATGEKTVYDLSGRRVLKPVKGLYIINGKKVYVK